MKSLSAVDLTAPRLPPQNLEAEQSVLGAILLDNTAMAKAMEVANDLNSLPPLAVRWTKVSVNKMMKQQFNLIMDAAIAYEMLSMVSNDHKAAAQSFVDKQKPVYKGF